MEQPWERKRRISNTIGILTLAFILVSMGVYWVVNYLGQRSKVTTTQTVLKELCKGFAKNDKGVIVKWAKGEYKDGWGNQIVLEADDRSKVVFVSKGPDGQLGTTDDIRSEECRPSSRAEAQNAVNVNVADVQKQAEDAAQSVQKAAEKGEVQGERGGWKWRIRWGRSDDKKE